MRIQQRQRGFLILMAAILIALGALLAVVGTFLNVTRSESAGGHLGSTQALMIAQAGIERAVYEYRRGTACNGLSAVNADLGNGNFAVTASLYDTTVATVFTGGVSATASTIPVNSVAAYASHGRIRIDNEEINYTGTSTDATLCSPASACFTGAIRGVSPSAAAVHTAGASVYQNQCLIRSVGVATNTSGQRILEANVPGWSASAFLDGGSTTVNTTMAQKAALTGTNMPAGTNLVIVVVTLRNTAGEEQIDPGDLQLRRGNSLPAIAVNESMAKLGGGTDGDGLMQETQFLLYRDTAAAANQSYTVWSATANDSVLAETKMLVINNPPYSDFIDGTSRNISNAGLTQLANLNTTLPAGDYAVLAAVQLDNPTNGATAFQVGRIQLRQSGVELARNEIQVDVDRAGDANRGTGFLLMSRANNVAANMSYDVAAWANNLGPVGEAKILVIGGLKSALVNSGLVSTIGTTPTTISTLLTDFPAGENVVISTNQYDNTDASDRNITAGGEAIVFNGTNLAQNQYLYALCRVLDGDVCDDFASGLLARQANASPNVSFAVTADATAANVILGQTRIMALHLEQGLIDWVEIFQ